MNNTVTLLIVLLCGWGCSSEQQGEAPRCGQLKYPNSSETACDIPVLYRPQGHDYCPDNITTWMIENNYTIPDYDEEDEKRIIVMELSEDPQWKTGKELKEILAQGQTYIDLTAVGKFRMDKSGKLVDDARITRQRSIKQYPIPSEIRFPDEVQSIVQILKIKKLEEVVTALASGKNRLGGHSAENLGVKAAKWVRDYAENLIKKYAGPCAGVYEWQTIGISKPMGPWTGVNPMPMKTVIVRLQGSNLFLSEEVVILGAHLDTISRDEDFAKTEVAPGGDDNASGCAALLEVLRVLMEAKFRPRRTIEFHFYSYEEYGLITSSNVAFYYNKYKVNVVGVMNLDVVGYLPPNNPEADKVAISYIDTHEGLNKFITMLMDKYVDIPWENKEVCKYCNSDHAAWTYMGFPAVFPHEKILSPYLHSKNDTIDTVNFEYLLEFTKLALAFTVEYGEPIPIIKWKRKK